MIDVNELLEEAIRETENLNDGEVFLTKYHRTLTTYLNTLLSNSFIINQIVEPQPPENMMDIPGMADEMRRPMMLIVSAKKKM